MSTSAGFGAAGAAGEPLLSVGIVVFRSDPALLVRTLESLERAILALGAARAAGCTVTVIDNGPADGVPALDALLAGFPRDPAGPRPVLAAGHGNVGYGRGNNLAIERSRARYHLVLNPDAELEPDALVAGIGHLERDPGVGMVAATAFGPDGHALRLCKRRPSILVLALRAMPPRWVPRVARPMLEGYDVVPAADGCTDVTGLLVSGSFMLCRCAVLQAVGGFDPRYFLYFEDFDLSLRIGERARLHWLADVRLLHHGGKAAAKGWAHRRMFAASALRFFATHGWRIA
ncbi:MAG: N-acetylglucosaminyl-diphospho-decaprenol L-rhamnosyltransferase [Pseudomonadota bacterium]